MATGSLSFLFRTLLGAGLVAVGTSLAIRALAETPRTVQGQTITPNWEFVADTVMGGRSTGQIVETRINGRDAMRLEGEVSLENDGGFVQMATDLSENDEPLDATAFAGIEIDVLGNNEDYELRIRTTDLTRPWQSYPHTFTASPEWRTIRIAFDDLGAHRTDAPFDPAHLRRLGIVAIGRVFQADVAVAGLRFYSGD